MEIKNSTPTKTKFHKSLQLSSTNRKQIVIPLYLLIGKGETKTNMFFKPKFQSI